MTDVMPKPDPLKGYKGKARSILQQFDARVWADAEIETTRGLFKGIILPRSETQDDLHIVMKLRNGYKGLIIAGTGLGHVDKPLYPALKRAVESGMHIFMTVETLWGYVQMYVYDTGRDIMALGVVPGGNMLPEVAYVKLCWVLGHTNDRDKVGEMMLTPVNNEITSREPIDGYLIYQGGLPEIENLLKQYMR
jgi:hypothetical protein